MLKWSSTELSYLFTGEHYRTGICSVQIDEDENIFETKRLEKNSVCIRHLF